MTKYKITMDELLELIKQKKYSAVNDLEYETQEYKCGKSYDTGKIDELNGEINAYTDLICLIESKKG